MIKTRKIKIFLFGRGRLYQTFTCNSVTLMIANPHILFLGYNISIGQIGLKIEQFEVKIRTNRAVIHSKSSEPPKTKE